MYVCKYIQCMYCTYYIHDGIIHKYCVYTLQHKQEQDKDIAQCTMQLRIYVCTECMSAEQTSSKRAHPKEWVSLKTSSKICRYC